MSDVLLLLPYAMPLAGAALGLLLWRWQNALRLLGLGILAATVAAAIGVLMAVADRGVIAVQIGGWPAPLGITLVADRLSALMLLVSSTVLLAILLYAVGQGVVGHSEAEPNFFYPAYLTLAAGVCLVFLAGDLFNLFVAFEVMLAASYVLLTLGPNPARMHAGMTYAVVSLTSSILFLTSVAVTYAATGTVNLADLSVRTANLPEGLRTVLALMFLVVFGIKGAVAPLHLWLPDSYPAAITKITAVFAALLTKTAVYALIRTQTLLFPDGRIGTVLLVLAAATMLIGLLGALTQQDIHRVLSFALVGHIGYLVFGLGLLSVAGLTGAIVYLVHHIVVQATLFLVSDIMQDETGETSLERLGGLAGSSAFLAALFFVPAMSLSGVPPLSGFVAKLALLEAGFGSDRTLGRAVAAVAVLTGLLTLIAMSRVWTLAFWRPRTPSGEPGPAPEPGGRPDPNPGGRPDPDAGGRPDPPLGPEPGERPGLSRPQRYSRGLVRAVTAGMVALGLAIAVFAGPLTSWSLQAAADLVDRTAYRQAVGEGRSP